MVYEYDVGNILDEQINIPLGDTPPYTIVRFRVQSYTTTQAYISMYLYLQHNYSSTSYSDLTFYRSFVNNVLKANEYFDYGEEIVYFNRNPVNISAYGTRTYIPLDEEVELKQLSNLGSGIVKIKLNSPKIKLNGTSVNKVYFNGTQVNKVYFNGTQIR